jgi:hypothetical protein
MHTFQHDQFRIHHDGDFNGPITIVEKISDRAWISAQTDSDFVLALVRQHKTDPVQIAFQGERNDGEPTTIVIPADILAHFVADRYIRDRLVCWVEEADTDILLTALSGKLTLPRL